MTLIKDMTHTGSFCVGFSWPVIVHVIVSVGGCGRMVMWVVKFSGEGYKIRKDFCKKSMYSKKSIVFC